MLEFRHEASLQRLGLQPGCLQRQGSEEMTGSPGSDLMNRLVPGRVIAQRHGWDMMET